MTILITGGAGYIGSHTASYFVDAGEEVIVVDNLYTGNIKAVNSDYFYKIDIRDTDSLDEVFKAHNIEAVIHFAASSLVGESMNQALEYYDNNVFGMMCLLKVMKENKVNKLIFSSTAAIYGESANIPIKENELKKPTNTYGETKLTVEKMLHWFDIAYNIKFISLRYFNAAGAHKSGTLGEDHRPETHLIPLILQVALNKRREIFVYGNDYPTRDGTCVRDYIHVMDLASAHYLALKYLKDYNKSNEFNLCNGKGYSVSEVIKVSREITKHPIPVSIKERRKGDPPVLVASAQKAKKELRWKPEHSTLEEIVGDAWKWHYNNPEGYNDV